MFKRQDNDKTQQQLKKELTDLRRRIVELEQAETEHKQAEGALRESEEELEAIFNEVRDGIVLLDLTGKIIKINKRITDVTGYTEKYIVGKRFDFFKNFPPSSIAKMTANFIKAAAGRRVTPFEVIGYTKTGEKRFGEVYGSLLKKKGKAVGVLVVMTDITERKEAEEALQESEGRYRTLVDNIDLGITLVDVYHNIIMINAAQSARFNKPSREMIGKKCFREFEKRDAVCPHCPGVRTLATHKPAEVETEGVRDDGSRFQVRIKTFPILDQDGTAIGFIETAVDISKRKQAEDALRESEQKYRSILETMEEGYYEIDLAGNFTFCNEAECRIHGCSHDEMIGLNNQQYSSPETAKRIYAIFNKVFRTGIPAKIVDYEVTRKDGSMVMLETSASLLRNAKGEPIGFHGVSRDRTEQKKAEEALRQSEESYRKILALAPDSITISRIRDGRYLQVNDAFCQHTGYIAEEAIGRTAFDLNIFVDPADWERLVGVVRKHGRADGLEIRFRAKDGTILDDLVSARPIRFQGEDCQLAVATNIDALKKAQQALRESEQKYRTILESMEEGYAEVDLRGNFMFFNDALCRIHGRSREELMGMNNRQYMTPETAKRIFSIFNRVYRTGITAKAVDNEIIKKDGSVALVEESVSLLRNAAGEPIGFYGISRDRTEQKKAEMALRESEEKYRTILATMEEGYYEVDLAGNYTFFNETTCKHHGRSRDELMGMNYREHASPEAAKRIYAIFNKIYRTGIPDTIVDYEVIRKDGSKKLVEISVSLSRNASGEPIGFRGISRDRTEQKKAEEALRQSEEKYRTILENIENGYYEVDLAGNLIFFNDSLCKIFGYPRDKMMGMNNREYMSPETAKRTYQLFNEVYKKGEPTKIFDWEFIKIDGNTLNVEISISLMRDSKGESVGFRGILRDVTVRKQAEEALRESEEKYRSLVEFTEDSVYLVNRGKEYLFANETYLARLGLSRDHVIGRPYDDFHSQEDGEAFSEHIEKVLKTGRFVQYEHRSRTDGRYFLRTLSPVKELNGSIDAVTVIAKDITERKHAEEELQYIATHDALTGVPNRALFNDRLTLALTQADRNKKKLAVMLLDLDYFKDVNDTMGHSIGDQLLRVVGNRLTELLRKGDTVARVGGDEFLLLLAEIAMIKDANIIARKILEAFRKPFVFNDHEIIITTSIGVSIYPDDGADANTLTKHADVAMYRAKDKGRDNFQRYTPA